ncbi:unnamed protein product [Boreogadus saida]
MATQQDIFLSQSLLIGGEDVSLKVAVYSTLCPQGRLLSNANTGAAAAAAAAQRGIESQQPCESEGPLTARRRPYHWAVPYLGPHTVAGLLLQRGVWYEAPTSPPGPPETLCQCNYGLAGRMLQNKLPVGHR